MLRRVLLVVAAAAMVSMPAVLRAAEEPAGLWIGTTNVPDQGTDEVTLAITKTADGYGGTMSDSLNIVAKEALRDVRLADGVLRFGFTLTDGSLMKMTLTTQRRQDGGGVGNPGRRGRRDHLRAEEALRAVRAATVPRSKRAKAS